MSGAPEFHPAANLFPLMDEQALAELAEDIATNGLRDPIWRHPDGRIIDGRNRWLACQKAGVECRPRTYQHGDDTIVPFVVSRNLHRRHLTTAQRAALAADIATMRQGARTDIRSIELTSQPEAAKLAGVSLASAKRAVAVKRAAPELHEKVKAGEVTAGAARREAQKQSKPAPLKGGIIPRNPASRDPQQDLVLQVCSLLHRLREVSQKISPAELRAAVQGKLVYDFELSMVPAADFIGGLFIAHVQAGVLKAQALAEQHGIELDDATQERFAAVLREGEA
jgi:ParB-like nuclease domain